MTHYEFTVSQRPRSVFILIPFCLVLGGGFYYAYDTTEQIPYAIASAGLGLLLVYFLLKTVFYRVNIQGRTVSVRTWLGYRYQFTLWDIEKITFVEHLQNNGPASYQLRIRAAGRMLYADSSMKNFDLLVKHLVSMHEQRQIKPDALPASEANKLYLFRAFLSEDSATF